MKCILGRFEHAGIFHLSYLCHKVRGKPFQTNRASYICGRTMIKGAVSPEISMFCFVCLIVIVISLAKNKTNDILYILLGL